MNCVVAMIPVFCLVLAVISYWDRLFVIDSVIPQAPFTPWLVKGLFIPLFLWIALNCGIGSFFPPLIPEIAIAKSRGSGWFFLVNDLTGPGVLVIGSFWAAASFAHLLFVIGLHAEPRNEFFFMSLAVSLVFLPIAALVIWCAGLASTGTAFLCWSIPVVHCTFSLACRRPHFPSYAQAIAQLKFGKYKDAEWTIIEELEKSAGDFEGWMLLADLYANHFSDLQEADRTIQMVCDQPNVSELQKSIAFHRLADWHLKLCDDPTGAKRALEELGRRLPGTHWARMARLRIEQLPESRRELLEQRNPRRVRLPALSEALDDQISFRKPELPRHEALSLVNELVNALKQNPNNIKARERLAIVFTEELGKVDLGIEQLKLLLAMSGPSEEQKVEWLSLTAAWHARYRKDSQAAREIFEKVVREYPQTPQAFAAQRRLNLMEMDEPVAKA